MNKVKILLQLSILLIASYSFAGVKVIGNGGDAVVCYTDATSANIKSVQFFDYWEQPQVINYGAVDLGGPQLSVADKIQLVTARIQKFDPNLAQFIKTNALNLAYNLSDYLVSKYLLPDIQDMNPKAIPSSPDCYIEQFAIQYKDVQTGQKRFYISESLYNHPNTSNDSKAGLLLHEAIYRFAILNQDAKNSDGVRLFNYTIATSKLDSLATTQLESYLKLLEISEILDKNACILKGDVLVKNTGYYNSQICYNTVLVYGNIKLSIPANAELRNEYPSIFRLPTGWTNNLFEIEISYPSGKTLSFTTDSVVISKFSNGQFLDVSIKTLKNGDLPEMVGPLNKTYSCSTFKMNIATNELLECGHNDASASFYFFKKTNKEDRWVLGRDGILNTLKYNITLPVLGSKKGLSYAPSTLPYTRLPEIYTQVDSNLNLVAGSLHVNPEQQTPVEVNGFVYNITGFEVMDTSGKYVLTATTTNKYFLNPKNRNLRLINSKNDYNANLFCAMNGYKTGTIQKSKIEYINGKSEQFFDINTNSIAYKVDEDVRVVDSILCDAIKVETENY